MHVPHPATVWTECGLGYTMRGEIMMDIGAEHGRQVKVQSRCDGERAKPRSDETFRRNWEYHADLQVTKSSRSANPSANAWACSSPFPYPRSKQGKDQDGDSCQRSSRSGKCPIGHYNIWWYVCRFFILLHFLRHDRLFPLAKQGCSLTSSSQRSHTRQ